MIIASLSSKRFWLFSVLTLLCAACGSEDDPAQGTAGAAGASGSAGTAGAAGTAGTAGAAGAAGGNALVEISDCGGFPRTRPLSPDCEACNVSYCDAERLHWKYIPETATLQLLDARAMLNCCGDRSGTLTVDGNTVVFAQVDAPENGGRCDCTCPLDFAADKSGIDVGAGKLNVRITRHVTDEMTAPTTVFEGEIDLSAGSGMETIDATLAPMCTES